MSNIALITDDEGAGIGIGPEHGPIQTRLNALITKVNQMDTPTEFPYTPTATADWPSTDPVNVQEGLDMLAERLTDAEADVGSLQTDVGSLQTDVGAIVDDHIQAVCTPLPAQTDEAEVTATLNGDVANKFIPESIVITVESTTGAVAGDGTVNVGTTTGGNEIASAQALTGLDAAGKSRRIPLSAATYAAIAGNATIYANVEANDSTATTLVLSVRVFGKQI